MQSGNRHGIQLWTTALMASQPVKNFMMNKYPSSAGEIYCMSEPEFNEYYDYLENGGKPTIERLPKTHQLHLIDRSWFS